MIRKLGIEILSESEGTGRPIGRGDKVKVRLNGWLNKGDKIQKDHVDEIVVGRRRWAPGIEYSLEGMKKGGTRKVRIGPHLAYRDAGAGKIPKNAVLVYEIEILEVEHRAHKSRLS